MFSANWGIYAERCSILSVFYLPNERTQNTNWLAMVEEVGQKVGIVRKFQDAWIVTASTDGSAVTCWTGVAIQACCPHTYISVSVVNAFLAELQGSTCDLPTSVARVRALLLPPSVTGRCWDRLFADSMIDPFLMWPDSSTVEGAQRMRQLQDVCEFQRTEPGLHPQDTGRVTARVFLELAGRWVRAKYHYPEDDVVLHVCNALGPFQDFSESIRLLRRGYGWLPAGKGPDLEALPALRNVPALVIRWLIHAMDSLEKDPSRAVVPFPGVSSAVVDYLTGGAQVFTRVLLESQRNTDRIGTRTTKLHLSTYSAALKFAELHGLVDTAKTLSDRPSSWVVYESSSAEPLDVAHSLGSRVLVVWSTTSTRVFAAMRSGSVPLVRLQSVFQSDAVRRHKSDMRTSAALRAWPGAQYEVMHRLRAVLVRDGSSELRVRAHTDQAIRMVERVMKCFAPTLGAFYDLSTSGRRAFIQALQLALVCTPTVFQIGPGPVPTDSKIWEHIERCSHVEEDGTRTVTSDIVGLHYALLEVACRRRDVRLIERLRVWKTRPPLPQWVSSTHKVPKAPSSTPKMSWMILFGIVFSKNVQLAMKQDYSAFKSALRKSMTVSDVLPISPSPIVTPRMEGVGGVATDTGARRPLWNGPPDVIEGAFINLRRV